MSAEFLPREPLQAFRQGFKQKIEGFVMDIQTARRHSAEPSKALSLRDLTIVVVAIMAIIFANIGVVRALDVALDAFHR